MDVNVCSSFHANPLANFNFINNNTVASTVSAAPGQTWPFSPASPITVPARSQGGPGSVPVQVLNLANGTYTYLVDGCITGGQSKTVTIP